MSIGRKFTMKTIPVYLLTLLLIFFAHPTLSSFLVGLILIVPGEALRIWACGHLKKNKEVTTTGPYAYVKNPLYLGTLFIMTGFCIMTRNYYIMGLGIAIFLIYYIPFKKKAESDRLQQIFGETWSQYDKNVPDYIPNIYPYTRKSPHKWNFTLVKENSEFGTLFSTLAGVLIFIIHISI